MKVLVLELDIDYTDWHSFGNTDLHLSTGATPSIPEELATQVADANNHSVSVGLGLLCSWVARAGNLRVNF